LRRSAAKEIAGAGSAARASPSDPSLSTKRGRRATIPDGTVANDKTKISNADLTAIFYERIARSPDCPLGIQLAIIPVEPSGWTARMNTGQRSRHPLCAKRFDMVLKQLRATYDLARD